MSYGYASGWCVHCGRRRGADGRCTNCDPWYTSGLVQAGVPLLAVTAIGLTALIAALSPNRWSPSRAASAPPPPSRLSFSSPAAPYAVGPAASPPSAPVAYVTPRSFPMTSSTSAPRMSEDELLWARIEALRTKVWAADAAARGASSGQIASPTPGNLPQGPALASNDVAPS